MAWILGIKGAGWHNASVCLLDSDSEDILFSSEEERFNNEKKTLAYPVASLAYALDRAGITPADIRHVGFPMSCDEYFDSLVMGLYVPLAERDHRGMPALKANLTQYRNLQRIERFLGMEFPRAAIHMLDHHLCHVTSAHFCAPFDESAVLTVDGMGESATTTFSHASGPNIRVLQRVGFPFSVGLLYDRISRLLGFGGPGPEGKVMGLAAYGEPRFIDIFREMLVITGKMQFGFGMAHVSLGEDSSLVIDRIHALDLLGLPRAEEDELTQHHMDVAASLQLRLEEVVIQMAHDLYDATESENLCLSGGVALNSVMNKKLVDQTPFTRVFIQPACDDGGTPLGAALAIKHLALPSARATVWRGPYLGAAYSNADIQKTLDSRGIHYTRPDDLVGEVARRIASGDIIGWFQGGAELGPRALGNRSILCDPRPAEMKDILNQRVKHREWFRPYAPSVLAARSSEFFDLDGASPYMLLVADVRPERRAEVAGITHVDGTARVQTVTEAENPLYHDLITSFGEITGVPMLLNTSFNVRGEAIVNTPGEPLDCLLFTGLDCLAIGDFLVAKSENGETAVDVSRDDYIARRRDRHAAEFATAIQRVDAALDLRR